MNSPFVTTAPWQDTIHKLATRWFATGKPTATEWTELTRAMFEASQDRKKSGWGGDDLIYEAGFADGSVIGYDDGYAAGHDNRGYEVSTWMGRAYDGP